MIYKWLFGIEGIFAMLKQSLSFLIFAAVTSQGHALAKAFSCKQVKTAPEEIVIDVMTAAPGAPQTVSVRKIVSNFASSAMEFQVVPAVVTDPKLKAQLISSEISLVVSAAEGRSSDGDFGMLTKFTGKNFAPQEMICWFFKHSK